MEITSPRAEPVERGKAFPDAVGVAQPTARSRNPAILSVFVAFLVLAFLGMWLYLNRSQSYPGAEEVEEILQVGQNFCRGQ